MILYRNNKIYCFLAKWQWLKQIIDLTFQGFPTQLIIIF